MEYKDLMIMWNNSPKREQDAVAIWKIAVKDIQPGCICMGLIDDSRFIFEVDHLEERLTLHTKSRIIVYPVVGSLMRMHLDGDNKLIGLDLMPYTPKDDTFDRDNTAIILGKEIGDKEPFLNFSPTAYAGKLGQQWLDFYNNTQGI